MLRGISVSIGCNRSIERARRERPSRTSPKNSDPESLHALGRNSDTQSSSKVGLLIQAENGLFRLEGDTTGFSCRRIGGKRTTAHENREYFKNRGPDMTEKIPDRLELNLGNFRASAVGKLAVGGLLVLVLLLIAYGAL